MHVPKGHAERRVTHQLLNRLRRRAPHGEVRAEGVPEHVRADDPKPSPLAAEAERASIADCVNGLPSAERRTPALLRFGLGLRANARNARPANVQSTATVTCSPASSSTRARASMVFSIAGAVLHSILLPLRTADVAFAAARAHAAHLLGQLKVVGCNREAVPRGTPAGST
jgi:hypothetical protein